MTLAERLDAVRARLAQERLDVLVAVHDGAHFIETPNPVLALTGFKSIGPAAVVVDAQGVALVVTPAWDAARAGPNRVVAATGLAEGVMACLEPRRHGAVGLAGLGFAAHGLVCGLRAALPQARAADAVLDVAACKTDDEIANAREATRIAELAYARLIEIARPGASEDELAAELKWYTKSLGAEDNFLLLCAGPHNRAVAPSNGRRLAAGDIVLAEITPSVGGQLAQICRTLVLGEASATLQGKYDLVVAAMLAGIRAAVPGAPMSMVCAAIDAVLEREGYAEYCRPPHIRRRGHGLGFGAVAPGDVARDNHTPLAPGMVFMIHPNQYLPETGYLLCGEPVLMTEAGAEPLTRHHAALAHISA